MEVHSPIYAGTTIRGSSPDCSVYFPTARFSLFGNYPKCRIDLIFKNNLNDKIVKTEEWCNFQENNPTQALELLTEAMFQ